MKKRDFIAADTALIPVDAVDYVDTEHLAEEGYIDVRHGGKSSRITGFFAIEAAMLLKPSALEGKRMRWQKRVWFVHNVVAHPLMQFIALAGDLVKPLSMRHAQNLYRAAMRVHDATVPVPTGFHQKRPSEITPE